MSREIERALAVQAKELSWLRRQVAKIPLRVARGGGGGGASFVEAADIAALNAVAGDYTPPRLGYTLDDGHYWALNDDSTAWWSISHSI